MMFVSVLCQEHGDSEAESRGEEEEDGGPGGTHETSTEGDGEVAESEGDRSALHLRLLNRCRRG